MFQGSDKANNKSSVFSPHAFAAFIGILAYAACIAALYVHIQDRCFLCAAIFLPIMLCGADKIVRQESSLLLIVGSFGAAITSIEHYCAAALIVLLWAVCRFLRNKKLTTKDLAGDCLLILIPMISGGLLAAFAVLPALIELITGGYRHFRFPFYDLLILPSALIIGDCLSWLCRELIGCAPRPYGVKDPRRSGTRALCTLISCSILSLCGRSAPLLPGYKAPYDTDIKSISEIPYVFPFVSSYSYYITQSDWLSLESGAQVEALHKSLVLDVAEGSFLPEYDARTIVSLPGNTVISDGTAELEISLDGLDQILLDKFGENADSSEYELHAVYHKLRFTPDEPAPGLIRSLLSGASQTGDSTFLIETSAPSDTIDTADSDDASNTLANGTADMTANDIAGTVTSTDTIDSTLSTTTESTSAADITTVRVLSYPEITISTGTDRASCTISYQDPGTYCYDSLDIVIRSSDAMCEELWNLADSSSDNVEASYIKLGSYTPSAYPYRVSLMTNYEKPRLLLLKVPYSKGWHVSMEAVYDSGSGSYAVDDPAAGEPLEVSDAEVMRADARYMAVQVPAGSYEITWVYTPPLFYQGVVISLIALIWVIIWLAYEKSPKRYRYFYY